MRRLTILCLTVAGSFVPAASPSLFQPDPRTVQRHGAGYRYTAVLVTAENLLAKRFSIVVVTGLSAYSTREVIQRYATRGSLASEIIVYSAGKSPRALVK
jgi:hypothetical protein